LTFSVGSKNKGVEKIVKCEVCGKNISNKAITCPHYGNPMNKNQTIEKIVEAVVEQNKRQEESSINVIIVEVELQA
jgi:ribosomal protein S26